MELRRNVTPSRSEEVTYAGSLRNIKIDSGQTLKFETSPGGVELLNVEVPAGKRWVATIQVNVQEFDV